MDNDLLKLVFQPDNPCNTNIIDNDDGRIMYQVATEHAGSKTVTSVRNSGGEVIASWEWRDVRSDIITLGRTAPVSVSAWLKKSVVPFKDTVTFHDHTGRTFKWKGNAPGLQLELYCDGDKKRPIARFYKSRRLLNRQTNPHSEAYSPAHLLLDSRGEQIMDLIVISFLVLEKSRRFNENSTMSRADVLGTPTTVV